MIDFFQSLKIDTVQVMDSTEVYKYWASGYYDTIPKARMVDADVQLPFSEMVTRYQNKDFEYVESISNKLSFLDKFIANIKNFFADLFPATQLDFNEGIFNLLAVIGGLIILFLIYKFFVSRKRVYIKHEVEPKDMEQQVDFVERNLMQVDVKTYLTEALKQKNYTLAIRYLQLMNIQLLGQKGILQWNRSKTNMELMESVDNQELKSDFLACASLFDYAWFGSFDVTAATYERYADKFTQFQRRWS